MNPVTRGNPATNERRVWCEIVKGFEHAIGRTEKLTILAGSQQRLINGVISVTGVSLLNRRLQVHQIIQLRSRLDFNRLDSFTKDSCAR